jgi:quercetin dioxygenase-like cupin family protein
MNGDGHSTVALPGILRGPGEGDQVANLVGGGVTYRARGEETDGALTLIESVAAPGEGPPLHVHVGDDEFIYVLEGRLRVYLGEVLRDASAGSFVFIPRGVRHTWQNVGGGAARFLFGFAPAAPGVERFFEQTAQLPAASRVVEGFRRFAGDAGIGVVGPPLAQSHPITQASVRTPASDGSSRSGRRRGPSPHANQDVGGEGGVVA